MRYEDLPASLFHQQHRCVFKEPRYRGSFSLGQLKILDQVRKIAGPYLIVDFQDDCRCETEDYQYDPAERILVGYDSKIWRLDERATILRCPTRTVLTPEFVRQFLLTAFNLAEQDFAPDINYNQLWPFELAELDPNFNYFHADREFTGVVGCNLAGGFCWAMTKSFVKIPKGPNGPTKK